MSSTPRTPTGLDAPGRKLWASIVADFELAEHELAQLEEAARTRDLVGRLRDELDGSPLMLESSQGMRLHPAVAELRQQRLTLARLLATLGVPGLEEDSLPASRGVRGVYGGRSAARS